MKRTIMMTALLALMAAGALPALARDHGFGGGERPSFSDFDADGNGEVTIAELDAFRAARMAEVDTNGDGQVDRAEFLARATAQAEERAAAMFDRLDADGDGILPGDLIAQRAGPRAERVMERLDADGSGGISEEEFAEMLERREARRDGKHRFGGGHGRDN